RAINKANNNSHHVGIGSFGRLEFAGMEIPRNAQFYGNCVMNAQLEWIAKPPRNTRGFLSEKGCGSIVIFFEFHLGWR
ncbi:MAG: hypothetical protein DYG96_15820, partial [Chlorobi bacterium CHB2]|nr:hypothetical protein [Chlorobi bacterium CHB2]